MKNKKQRQDCAGKYSWEMYLYCAAVLSRGREDMIELEGVSVRFIFRIKIRSCKALILPALAFVCAWC